MSSSKPAPAAKPLVRTAKSRLGEMRHQESLLKTGALQDAILNSANFSSIATDEKGVIQIFNVGAEKMLGYDAADVINKITPADISDPREVIARAQELSSELGTDIAPGFEALAFKASRGIEDIYELTYIRKDGSRFPAVVSVTALRNDEDAIIGYLLIGTDNTARKAAEEALRSAGALQAAIFNSANFSSIATDANGVIQIFNVGAEKMLGYSAAEVVDQVTPADISDPEELIARAKSLSAELETSIAPGFEALVFKASRGIEDIYELTYVRKDGSRFPAVVSVTALRNDEGGIIGYLLIGTEVKAGALQAAIFSSANFSSIATDANGVIQIFNVGAEKMLGYDAADVINKITPADISDPREVIARAQELSSELGTDIAPGFEALAFKASRGIEDIYELTYIRKDGSRFPAIVSVTALRDAQDAIIGYLLIGTDNTARKEAEDRLRWTEESFRLMVESVTDYAIVMLDPEGCVASWNEGAERIKGYTAEEILGEHFSLFYTAKDRKNGLPQRELDFAAAEGRFEVEGLRTRKNESAFWANVVFTSIRDTDGNLRGFAKLTRDLTERRFVEAELINAKRVAEKASLAKSEFMSSMSHELRSPLNAILGFAQLLDSEDPPPTASQKADLAQILQAGWHLLKLIDEILDLARVESGRVPLSQEPISLSDIMGECLGMIEAQARMRDLTIVIPAPPEEHFVRADQTRVKQVLLNLLSNAVKYNHDHGTITIAYPEHAAGRVRVAITDTGDGLDADQLSHLFQPFNRLGQEAGGQEGTGIGLVVAKRLVELMDGSMGVESTVGVGSKFWFDLVAAEAPHLIELGRPETVEPGTLDEPQSHTLLYIEDNPANLRLVEQIISRHANLHLLTATTGKAGVSIVRANPPDVILMDINLPDIDGFEVLRLLRADPTTDFIPAVAISANAMPRDIRHGLDAGFLRYITKPIQVNEFVGAVGEAVEVATAGRAERELESPPDEHHA